PWPWQAQLPRPDVMPAARADPMERLLRRRAHRRRPMDAVGGSGGLARVLRRAPGPALLEPPHRLGYARKDSRMAIARDHFEAIAEDRPYQLGVEDIERSPVTYVAAVRG